MTELMLRMDEETMKRDHPIYAVDPSILAPAHPASTLQRAYPEATQAVPAPAKTLHVDAILVEREERYGGFSFNAAISQGVKSALRSGRQWNTLRPEQKEALEMIANKLCRIVAGKADYRDSWDDIAGYATLVARTLEQESR